MADRSEIEELLRALSPSQRRAVLEEAGVQRSIYEDEDRRGVLHQLDAQQARNLVVPLLQRVRLTNDQFKKVAGEAYIDLWSKGARSVEMRFSAPASGVVRERVPIPELAAASLVVWELSLRIGRVLRALEVPDSLDPPEVTVAAGSINFSFGGGPLLVAGLGFVVAAHAAMPPGTGADIAFFGGSILAALGIPDLILGWRRALTEEEKTRSETVLNQAKARQSELESLKLMRELAPPSALVPAAQLAEGARRYGIEPALGAHLANEILPVVAELTQQFSGPVTASSGPAGRSTSA
jgi:hypothetical protein